jgi:hypothetical protein
MSEYEVRNLATIQPRSAKSAYAEQPPRLSTSRYRWLPYLVWTCGDGREVLFNHGYRPIWQRRPGKAAEKANPDEWVLWIVKRQYLFDDGWGAIWGDSDAAAKARAPIERALLDFLYGAPVRGLD